MRLPTLLAVALATASPASCGSPQAPSHRLADQCEVSHTFRGEDEIDAHISRLDDGWVEALRMRVHLGPDQASIEIRGLGRITPNNTARACQVVEANGTPGTPRFDADVCLDEIDSLVDVLDDAETAARPGETVLQEVRLRGQRRHRTRSHVGAVAAFHERAEITRDSAGRVVRLVRTTEHGGREEVTVTYPHNSTGRCLPAD
jgi:hypothetical protein